MKQVIYIVGFGSGNKKYMTEQAVSVIESVDLIVGYTKYIKLLKEQFPKQNYYETPMRKEVERCRIAVNAALKGKTIAIVSSGDSGIYGMAGIMLEVIDEMKADLEVIIVPGITAASLASAVLGAPLMHDFSVISLSDCMTPIELIYKRVSCSANADFVICLYNPKSNSRREYLANSAEIILKYRSPETPVGIVRNAGRSDEKAWITTLKKLKDEPVDMFCIVIVGNSQTYVKDGKMITPRGYCLSDNFNDGVSK